VAQAVHESASAAVLDGDDIVYVARVESRKIMRVQITVGTRFPAYVTSMGRVLLADLETADAERILRASDRRALTPHTTTEVADLVAELSRVREAGYSLVDQELELGLRSLAVPVRDSSGRVVAAINVSTTAAGAPRETLAAVLPTLLAAQADIEVELASLGR
jgi:IclR family pca regulon transcriptional regulator